MDVGRKLPTAWTAATKLAACWTLLVSMATTQLPPRRCLLFEAVPSLRDVTTEAGLLWETRATSVRQCGTKCALQSQCQAFLFREATANCRGLLQTPLVAESSQAEGYRLFRRSGACPRDLGYVWSSAVSMCLKVPVERAQYWGASKRCRAEGGDLVIIRTAQENAFVMEVLQPYKGTPVMTGGIRVATGVYEWVDGSQVTQFFYSSTSVTHKHVVLIHNGSWTTGAANWDRKFICQLPAPSEECV